MSKQIPLTRGMFAIVDDEDFERVNQFKWHAGKQGNIWYAIRTVRKPNKRLGIKGAGESLHRRIRNFPESLTDHINGNGLDCRKSNMRDCTSVQNARNSRGHSDSISKYKGVSFWSGKWRAQIFHSGTKHHIGHGFKNAKTAARAYDEAAKKYFGEFARTNF
jgi:hypothetical protein